LKNQHASLRIPSSCLSKSCVDCHHARFCCRSEMRISNPIFVEPRNDLIVQHRLPFSTKFLHYMLEVLKYLSDLFFSPLRVLCGSSHDCGNCFSFASLLGGITIGEIDMQGARFDVNGRYLPWPTTTPTGCIAWCRHDQRGARAGERGSVRRHFLRVSWRVLTAVLLVEF
jgi:hypothetical protein